LLRIWAKTHIQQCRISTFFGGGAPDPPLTGARRGREGKGGVEGEERSKGHEGLALRVKILSTPLSSYVNIFVTLISCVRIQEIVIVIVNCLATAYILGMVLNIRTE